MKGAKENLFRYRNFLASIPLANYRDQFQKVKWVEQDLPNEMLPQKSIFNYYWKTQNFLSFESWFDSFWEELHTNPETLKVLKEFKKYHFDKDNDGWFKKGFEARMNRTWVSVLTQLDFCYMLSYVAQKQNKILTLECNADLDIKKGIDLKIGNVGFQVAKISQRKEARAAAKTKKKGQIEVLTIPYPVYNIEEIKRKTTSPRVVEENRAAYGRTFHSFYKYCELLNNGFVVFAENYIAPIVKNIADIQKLKQEVKQISLELSGEI